MNPVEKKLLKHFQNLAMPERDMLMAFAEFLATRSDSDTSDEPIGEPLDLPRPDEETIVAAIKRQAPEGEFQFQRCKY